MVGEKDVLAVNRRCGCGLSEQLDLLSQYNQGEGERTEGLNTARLQTILQLITNQGDCHLVSSEYKFLLTNC